MAETTGSATDLEDLMTKFLTWAVASGWTQDEAINTFDSGRQCAISKGTCFVQFRWSTSAPNSIAMYQSTGYTGSTRAGSMPGDSGSGYNTNNSTLEANITVERCVELVGNGAIANYYFNTNSTGDYLHVVIEVGTQAYRHFGCGTSIEKFSDWDTMTGGAYCYGHVGVALSTSTGNGSGILLDGAANLTTTTSAMQQRSATMRLAGAPGQAGAGVWANIWGNRTFTEITDTAGNARATCIGGARGGVIARALGWIKAGSSSGLAPTLPLSVFYINKTPSPIHAYLLGFMPDVRSVHMKYLAPAGTFSMGGDTWRAFPTVRRVEGAAAGDTDFQGWAYNTSA